MTSCDRSVSSLLAFSFYVFSSLAYTLFPPARDRGETIARQPLFPCRSHPPMHEHFNPRSRSHLAIVFSLFVLFVVRFFFHYLLRVLFER